MKRFSTFDLDRYNSVLWAAVGTLVVLIVVISLLVVLAAMLYSLVKPDHASVPVAKVGEETRDGAPRTQAVYDFCQPVAVFGTPYQLIRVVSDRFMVRNKPAVLPEKQKRYGSYSGEAFSTETCGIYGSDRSSAAINVMVRNADTGEKHLVLKENAVIHTLEYPQPPASANAGESASFFPPPGVLYWEIAFDDTNGDNVIDGRDDMGAYLSGPDGRNLVRITPEFSRVLEKTYDRKRNVLTLRIVHDTNNDKSIDEKDTPSLIEVNVAQRKMTGEILNAKGLTEFMRQAEPKRQGTP
jgi:hypothetical protein